VTKKSPTAGLVLAAGASSRLGRPKQLLVTGGQMLLARTVEAVLASRLDQVVLVLGHESGRILEAMGERLCRPRLLVTVNDRYREGMSSSLQHALQRVRAAFPSIMVIPSDHPFLDSTVIDFLLARFLGSDRDICAPCYKGRRGVPVSFASSFYDEIMAIRGDIGAREIVLKNPESVLEVELQDEDCFIDIDTEEDFARLKARHASRLRPLRK